MARSLAWKASKTRATHPALRRVADVYASTRGCQSHFSSTSEKRWITREVLGQAWSVTGSTSVEITPFEIGLGEFPRLDQNQPVPRVVAHKRFDTVGPLLEFLDEHDPLGR